MSASYLADPQPANDRDAKTPREAILEYLGRRDFATFPELQRDLESIFPTRGDFSLLIAPNILIWSGLSAQFCDAIEALLAERKVFLHPADWRAHLLCGGGLHLPVAKQPPRGGYRRPHWAPAYLATVPFE